MSVFVFENMIGKIMSSAICSDNKDELAFTSENGDTFVFSHEASCCEYVRIEDICGDLNDLVGSPILEAEEVDNLTAPKFVPTNKDVCSHTWTFYRFATVKGSVVVRWLGESNGCYSETVSYDERLVSGDGFSIADKSGTKCWFLNGELHREDGPAVEYLNGREEYWSNGKKLYESPSPKKSGRFIK